MDILFKNTNIDKNKQVRWFAFFAAITIMLVMGVGCQQQEPPIYSFEDTDYNARGSYAVGTMELTIEDADRPLNVTVWYPAQNPNNKRERVTYRQEPWEGRNRDLIIRGHAIIDALPAKDGPFPLVVYSHSNEGYRYEAVYLMEQLASNGFVVFAANHYGDSLQALDPEIEPVFENTYDFIVYRPQDITRVIDRAEAENNGPDTLAGIIDLDKVGVMGFSFGGWTAIASAGARLNFGEFDELFCQNPDYIDVDNACEENLPKVDRIARVAELEATPEGTWPSFEDPRVDAVVAMAPGYTAQFGRSGLESVEVPVLLLVGTNDIFLPLEFHTSWVYENIASEQKYHVIIEDGTHYFWTNDCMDARWTRPFGCTSLRAAWGESAFKLVEHYVTAFMLAELAGEVDARPAILHANPGITVRSAESP